MERTTLPLGILSVSGIRAGSCGKLRRHVQRLVADIPWVRQCHGLPVYLVGGSWRSLARAHIHFKDFPLPILSHYRIPATETRWLADCIAGMDLAGMKAIPGMPSGRLQVLADAAALLAALCDALAPAELIVSPFGLREGLLFQLLDAEARQEDPLIAGIGFMAPSSAQFPGQGAALSAWLNGLFGETADDMARLRHAVCLLIGMGWSSNPDFRALGGEEFALHGNWIGVYPHERAVMGMALYVGLGGSGEAAPILERLAGPEPLAQAATWGLSLRLAQKLSGGAPGILRRTALRRAKGKVVLELPPDLAPLAGEVVRRRLDQLASAMNLTARIAIAGGAAKAAGIASAKPR